MCIQHTFSHEILNLCVSVHVHIYIKLHLGCHAEHSYLLIHSHKHTALQSKCTGYACHCRQGVLCVPGEEEKARADKRQQEAISAQKAL